MIPGLLVLITALGLLPQAVLASPYDSDLPGLAIASIVFIVGFVLILILTFVFWLWMLADSIQRKYKEPSDKLVWVIVIIFTYILGAILYYILEKSHDTKSTKRKRR